MYLMPWETPVNETTARSLALQLLEYACNGSKGRPEKGDPVYDTVTEHRDFGAKYSSCGDLGHWLLYRLGVRLPFVNREEHGKWIMGQNISKMSWCPYAKTPAKSDILKCGDIIIIWSNANGTDAHLMCVIEDRTLNGKREIETANYGQPGGKIFTSKVTYTVSGGVEKLVLGTRAIQRWIPLMDVLEGAQKQNALEPAQDVTRESNGSLIWKPQ